MNDQKLKDSIGHLLNNLPQDWLKLTTHRIDRFNESLAKTEFIEEFEKLGHATSEEYLNLPTAFDYIRLGHPLSCVLEWSISKSYDISADNVISFSSQTMPLLAVLRKNKLNKIRTRIIYSEVKPIDFDQKILEEVYGYDFELVQTDDLSSIKDFPGVTIIINKLDEVLEHKIDSDFVVSIDEKLGSIIQVSAQKSEYISEIQHVRRRESIAMTPHNCHTLLKTLMGETFESVLDETIDDLAETINEITSTSSMPVIGSCGLSVQYAIMMGLIHHAFDKYKGKDIKFIVPPNCYGGTNDQARRVAACVDQVEIVDLAVDSGKDMVTELERILTEAALSDCVPFIIAEIPTNPRVEIPDLKKLEETLAKKRKTSSDKEATQAVFILDQTFCPNVKFLGEGDYLYSVPTISYVSGSKFPSGGLCTAGYGVANDQASHLMGHVDRHLKLCKNEATNFQVRTLTAQMPSMNERISSAYDNTRAFVEHIEEVLPQAKINFVSHELAKNSFTPSVFSLDLPSKGDSPEEREASKRELNLKLINMMISEIPEDSKYCVSYGQLKGCYWTIPATSTQGTTKEGDKDYIVRVSASGDMNLEQHKKVFSRFCELSY